MLQLRRNVYRQLLVRAASSGRQIRRPGDGIIKLFGLENAKRIFGSTDELKEQPKSLIKLPVEDTPDDEKPGQLMRVADQLLEDFKKKYSTEQKIISSGTSISKSGVLKLNCKAINHDLINIKEFNIPGSAKPPILKYDLNRILFEPMSLHPLKDSRTGVYNYDSHLENISFGSLEQKIIKDMNQNRHEDKNIPHFIKPYRDERLDRLAKKFGKQYISSTSSMTSVLSHLHFLLSNFRPLNIADSLISTKNLLEQKNTFTKGAQLPATIILRKTKNGSISIDSDNSLDKEMILSVLGHHLESFLTKEHKNGTEHYHYSSIDDFIIRSQLDAYDPRLPGSGIFDLKTRAVVAIRHDLSFVEENNNYTGYEINKLYGEFESLEREFFDLIRSTLLKYSFQARMGFMDGIFLAYHNISKIFGFQYMPLEEIDNIIHSNISEKFRSGITRREDCYKSLYGLNAFIAKYQRNSKEIAKKLADAEFKMSIKLFAEILNTIQSAYAKRNFKWDKLRVILKTSEETPPLLNIIVCPLPNDFEDKPLNFEKQDSSTKQDLDKLRKKISEIKPWQLSAMLGFQVSVSHFQAHHPDTINHLNPTKDKKHLIKRLKQTAYLTKHHTKTPEFFDPLDIEMWHVNATIKRMQSKKSILGLYKCYLDAKFDILQLEKQLSVLSNLDQKPFNKSSSKHLKRKNAAKRKLSGPSLFQKTLRAYSMRNALKKRSQKSKY